MQSTYNSFVDYENGLCFLKEALQDQDETERSNSFHGGARIVGISDHPRQAGHALNCNVAADFIQNGCWVKAKTVEFWVNLGTTTEKIIDPVVGNDIEVIAGMLTYIDWDNAYVDAVDTDAIMTGWHHVAITSTTDVILTSGFNLGKGDIQVTGLRFWSHELSSTEITKLYSGVIGPTKNDTVLLLDFPNLADLSGNGNNATNHGADIVASGRNGGSCFDLISSNSDYIDCGNIGTIKSIVLMINPDNVTQSILDCDGGSHKITVSSGTIIATGFTAFYVDDVISGALDPKSWQLLVVTDSSGLDASALTFGKEGANYFDGMVDILGAFSMELHMLDIQGIFHRIRRGLLL